MSTTCFGSAWMLARFPATRSRAWRTLSRTFVAANSGAAAKAKKSGRRPVCSLFAAAIRRGKHNDSDNRRRLLFHLHGAIASPAYCREEQDDDEDAEQAVPRRSPLVAPALHKVGIGPDEVLAADRA